MIEKRLMTVRRRLKRKKPRFLHQEQHKHLRLRKLGGRRPTGNTSKMRIGEQGRGTKPSPGWRSPALVRGLSRSGKLPVVVHSAAQLSALDAAKNAAIIGRTVGARKRAALLAAAEQARIEVLNQR